MTCFAIEGDIRLNEDESDAVLFDDVEELKACIRRGFQLVKGTWVFDRAAGFPLHERAFVRESKKDLLIQAVHAYLSTFDRVQDVKMIDVRVDPETRDAVVTYTCKLDTSEVLVDDLKFPVIG